MGDYIKVLNINMPVSSLGVVLRQYLPFSLLCVNIVYL